MLKKIRDTFKSPTPFELDSEKEYSNQELIDILRIKYISLDTGNKIVLILLDRLNKKISECDH